jgi:hypothetical protein
MFGLDDVNTIESGDATEEEYFSALQRAINSGDGWKLQGSYGRSMMDAIEAGKCLLGHNRCRDYWGNMIPGRYDVKPGTKGSVEFVIEHSGEAWGSTMEAVL